MSPLTPAHTARQLTRRLSTLRFGPPVEHVYNPLVYGAAAHDEYLRRFGKGPREIIMLGMNPGPWGMMQTGVPFGDPVVVRDWLAIRASIQPPADQHPKRPVLGLASARKEVSGTRLWGWARETFESPDRFFARFFVANYCPLAFLDRQGRNVTPDKLKAVEQRPLLSTCDWALRQVAEYFQPRRVIGIGKYATTRAQVALDGWPLTVGGILHPSPANPKANRNWAATITRQLHDMGVGW